MLSKNFIVCCLFTALHQLVAAQAAYEKQPSLLGVHFTMQDFTSKKWGGRFSSMTTGVSVSYLKGINRRLDLGMYAGAAFPDSIELPRSVSSSATMYQLGLSARLRAFPYPRTFQPFIFSGIEGALMNKEWSSFLIPGLGLQVSHQQVSFILQTGYGWEISGHTGNKFFYSAGIAGLIRPSKGKHNAKKAPPVTLADVAAAIENRDQDKDGIQDSLDKCPDQAGIEQFSGCPDSDADGIQDAEDKCPRIAGSLSLGGCPFADTDKDGVPDTIDKCPDQMGFAETNGCPVQLPVVGNILAAAAAEIYFETAKYTLLPSSYPALQRVDSLLRVLPWIALMIEGHTDNQGDDEINLKLSRNRAAAVKEYLIGKGHDEKRFTASGFGASKPVDTNDSPEGRQRNRRVIMRVRE